MKIDSLYLKDLKERSFESRLGIKDISNIPYAVLAKDQRLISLRVDKKKPIHLRLWSYKLVSNAPIITVPTNGLEVFE